MLANCEVCGAMADGEFKSACFKLRLCLKHARDWDDAVCDMPEWKAWMLADVEFKTVWAAIQGGSVPITLAISESLRALRQADVEQRKLRPLLKELFGQMQAKYKSKTPKDGS